MLISPPACGCDFWHYAMLQYSGVLPDMPLAGMKNRSGIWLIADIRLGAKRAVGALMPIASITPRFIGID